MISTTIEPATMDSHDSRIKGALFGPDHAALPAKNPDKKRIRDFYPQSQSQPQSQSKYIYIYFFFTPKCRYITPSNPGDFKTPVADCFKKYRRTPTTLLYRKFPPDDGSEVQSPSSPSSIPPIPSPNSDPISTNRGMRQAIQSAEEP